MKNQTKPHVDGRYSKSSGGDEREAQRSTTGDVVIAPGLSVHIYGKRVGLFCERIEAGKGFAELPLRDFVALIRHFAKVDDDALLDGSEREGAEK